MHAGLGKAKWPGTCHLSGAHVSGQHRWAPRPWVSTVEREPEPQLPNTGAFDVPGPPGYAQPVEPFVYLRPEYDAKLGAVWTDHQWRREPESVRPDSRASALVAG